MRNKITIKHAKNGTASVVINGSTYDVDYSNDDIPFTAFKNGKCVSGIIESQWIYSKTNGAVGSAAFRMMLEQHEEHHSTHIQSVSNKLTELLKDGRFSDILWPLLYPKNYCRSYINSGNCDRTIAEFMLLRADCDEQLKEEILNNTGVCSTTVDLTSLIKTILYEQP